jgi:hypothetical protein
MCHCETTILPFLASQIADMVAQRAELGKDFGVVLIPEGLVEFMHDVSALIAELNELMAAGVNPADQTAVVAHLTPESADVSAGVWGSGSCVWLAAQKPAASWAYVNHKTNLQAHRHSNVCAVVRRLGIAMQSCCLKPASTCPFTSLCTEPAALLQPSAIHALQAGAGARPAWQCAGVSD